MCIRDSIYSICVSEPKEEWEECLNEYSLKNRGIECIYASDYFGKDNLQKIRKQWKIDAFLHLIIAWWKMNHFLFMISL